MQIHVARAGQVLGVFSTDEVRDKLASGEFQRTDHGWTEGSADWTLLSVFPGLTAATPAAAPPESPPVVASPSQTTSAADDAAAAGKPVPTSGLAITSLVLGILSVTILPFVAAIAAIIVGHLARRCIARSAGTLGGSGIAKTGLTIGYWGFFLSLVAIMAGIAFSIAGTAQAKAKQSESLSHGRQIAIACQAYAVDHNGAFPKTLEELMPRYLPNPKTFVCPLSGPSVQIGYEYYGGKDSDPPSNILLVSKAFGVRKARIVVHVDTSAYIVRNMPSLPRH